MNSPGPKRRNTEADIFHTESPKNPLRKVSEPSGPKSPEIIVTFHDTDHSTDQGHNPLQKQYVEENRQHLYETYRVRRPSFAGSQESESGYSNHSSPGSPGLCEQQLVIDAELEEKLSEFQLNNPEQFQEIGDQILREVADGFNVLPAQSSSDTCTFKDFDSLLADQPSSATSVEQEVYDGDEILRQLSN